mmetsp:Transcript_26767/g.62128  ORF Transcript_26767/g.62128 Transcript_26767/m.62128 type:complete len:104 (+) Transcript_26767:68-379(+)
MAPIRAWARWFCLASLEAVEALRNSPSLSVDRETEFVSPASADVNEDNTSSKQFDDGMDGNESTGFFMPERLLAILDRRNILLDRLSKAQHSARNLTAAGGWR